MFSASHSRHLNPRAIPPLFFSFSCLSIFFLRCPFFYPPFVPWVFWRSPGFFPWLGFVKFFLKRGPRFSPQLVPPSLRPGTNFFPPGLCFFPVAITLVFIPWTAHPLLASGYSWPLDFDGFTCFLQELPFPPNTSPTFSPRTPCHPLLSNFDSQGSTRQISSSFFPFA